MSIRAHDVRPEHLICLTDSEDCKGKTVKAVYWIDWRSKVCFVFDTLEYLLVEYSQGYYDAIDLEQGGDLDNSELIHLCDYLNYGGGY